MTKQKNKKTLREFRSRHPHPAASAGVQFGDRDGCGLPVEGGSAGHGSLSEIASGASDPD